MPELADYASGASTAGSILAPGTTLASILLTQRYNPAGKLIDVMQIGFTIDGYPGTFYIHPDANGQWLAAAPNYMEKEVEQVKAIYALGGS